MTLTALGPLAPGCQRTSYKAARGISFWPGPWRSPGRIRNAGSLSTCSKWPDFRRFQRTRRRRQRRHRVGQRGIRVAQAPRRQRGRRSSLRCKCCTSGFLNPSKRQQADAKCIPLPVACMERHYADIAVIDHIVDPPSVSPWHFFWP